MIDKLDGAKLKEVLSRHGFGFSKSLGQNFLSQERILNMIANDADINGEDTVLEIGPGAGTLTRVMAKRAKKVISIEIDRTLLPVLEETLDGFGVTVINNDFLKLDINKLYEEQLCPGFKLVANLPYYITTPIIMRVLESGLPFKSLTILVQREVAERMAATPGTPEYGSLTCAVQYYCTTKLQTKLPPACFFPPPKVESRVITLTRREAPPVQVKNEKLFFDLFHAAFNNRRKTYVNNLKSVFSLDRQACVDLMQKAGLDPEIRGERLSLENFARICNLMETENK
ncbi:MAG: 16S rRNA (adenine(1518)-N(6)/adenine(1519)-N(6))-dimethyltransferase RsmA [Clostridia bacterium]|nr:16S rRNA (adenine(1518)-N(6)/adenine(1519)-N(6))-dimethyltransferase RsmA [Clostridia bacterium]